MMEAPDVEPRSGEPLPDRPGVRRLLIVSDMHLGCDPRKITGFEERRPEPEFDRHFIACLRYYVETAPERWRVVLGGDCFDFVEVVVRPEEDNPFRLSFEVTKEERSVGLNTEAERARVKLEMILDYHRPLFEALARFVRRGGELVLVRGNHDAETFWGKVQRVFRQRLAELAYSGERLDVDRLLDERGSFQERVRFVPWCYIEPGRIYLEHGHQYDPYCSFDHQLYPVSPTDPRRIDTPLFMFAMRYFVNRLSDFASHYKDVWTTKDYLRWLRQKGIGGMLYTLGMAAEAGLRSLHYAGLFWVGRVGRYEEEHAKRLVEQAKLYDVSIGSLERIDALHYTPVTRNLPELMRLLFLDRLLLGVGAVLALGGVLGGVDAFALELVGVLGVLGAGYAVNRRLAPRRFILPGPRQAYAARDIAHELGVKVVVMGHSHQRRKVPLGDERWYVNTGCWLPPRGDNVHGLADTCTCNLSHLVVDERQADLRIFCLVHGRPRHDLPPTSPREPRDDPHAMVDLPPG